MAIFTAIATAIVGALGISAAYAAFAIGAIATTLGLATSYIIGRAMMPKGGAGGSGRVQLPPATDNKIPVVYGKAYIGGPVTDAVISTDFKTMWYVVTLAEHTDTTAGSGYTFGNIYYDGKRVNFGSNGYVNSLTTLSTPTQTDTKVAGQIYIWLFTNGSSSGVNTGGQTAIQIMNDPEIPAGSRWPATNTMTNAAFIIGKVLFNSNKGTTSLGGLQAELTNNLNKPGDVLLDYMRNTRYGCAIPVDRIDTVRLTELNTYSDANITYVNTSGGNSTQPRYRINGPVDTSNNCLENLQLLVDCCDSWLQYSELSAKWSVVINKEYTGSPNSASLFSVNSSNLIGGIDVSPIDLNQTFNQVEVGYPNKNIKDQTDYQIIDLEDFAPEVMSPNEAVNKLTMTLPFVNEAVQAKYIAVRRLLQSREDLAIVFKLDYTGIVIEAGDVIRVTHEVYGWTDKLFRVSNVVEEKTSDGSLGVSVSAFEYNDTIYADNAVEDFIPEENYSPEDPNVFGNVATPTVTENTTTTAGVKSFRIEGQVPAVGQTLFMDFNYGNTSNSAEHSSFRTIQASDGSVLTPSGNVFIDESSLPAGNYYFSITARNYLAGATSNSSNIFAWSGPGIYPYDPNSNSGGIDGNYIQPNSIGPNVLDPNINYIEIGNTLPISGDTGDVFFLTTDSQLYRWNGSAWTAAVPATEITGQIIDSQIANVFANSVYGNLINANIPNANILGQIIDSQIANVFANSVYGNLDNALLEANSLVGEITETQIANDAITTPKIAANSVFANKIAANTILANNIAAFTITGNQVAANSIFGNRILANSITSAEIQAATILANNIAADTITGNQIAANSVFGNRIVAASIETAQIAANAITANEIAANAVTTNQILAGAVTAAKIGVTELDAITANMGTLTSGNIQTDSNTANYRVEISSFGNIPIWYGNGTKTEANGSFYVTRDGDAFFQGYLNGYYKPLCWGEYYQTGNTTVTGILQYGLRTTSQNPAGPIVAISQGVCEIFFYQALTNPDYIVVASCGTDGYVSTTPTSVQVPTVFYKYTGGFRIATRDMATGFPLVNAQVCFIVFSKGYAFDVPPGTF